MVFSDSIQNAIYNEDYDSIASRHSQGLVNVQEGLFSVLFIIRNVSGFFV